MNKTVVTLSALMLVTSFAFAQKPGKTKPAKTSAPVAAQQPKADPVVFTFGNDVVRQSEFERLLSKNRNTKEAPDEATVREYLELYINFKMKVKEAGLMQLDTSSGFKTELAGYRRQLANPYLTDKKVTEALISEAYERYKTEVNASHILVLCAENAKPKDTLAAYNKIVEIRKRYLKGENFDSLAKQKSEDPSAVSNFGNLGWFSAFNMIYPFENMAYATAKGEVSQPFRTRYGYHLLKVNDKRPARGDVKIQHIMLQTGQSANAELVTDAKRTMDKIYAELQKGASFDSLVQQYSQDNSTKPNNGVSNWIGSLSSYPEEIKSVAYTLNPGEYSKPIQSAFGIHIIKLIEKRGLASQKDMEESIKNKINRDSRSESSKASVAQRIKKENNYKEYMPNVIAFSNLVDSNFLEGTWQFDTTKFAKKPVCSFNNTVYTTYDLGRYAAMYQNGREKNESVSMIVQALFKRFTEEKALEVEEGQLETKYEDFRNLMQEYHDGILLFDLTDKKVWSKAVTDTVGLEKFHEANKDKYMWKERVLVYTYTCLTEKAKKEAMKMAAAGKTQDEIKAKLNKKVAGTVIVTEQKAEKGENIQMDNLYDKKGVVDIADENGQFKFYYVAGVVAPEPKALKDARGLVTSDYQNYLEKEWIRELRAKYPVVVEESTIRTLFK